MKRKEKIRWGKIVAANEFQIKFRDFEEGRRKTFPKTKKAKLKLYRSFFNVRKGREFKNPRERK